MGKKITGWKTKGMNRDLSVSAYNAEFAFENVNLRLSTNEHNTLMSWVNERGTLALKLEIDTLPWEDWTPQGEAETDEDYKGRYEERFSSFLQGVPIGTAVLDHQLVVFTTKEGDARPDFIYVLEYSDDAKTSMKGRLLYNGSLGFSKDWPLETQVSYEADHIRKVYWTDGLNQPRMINIAASDDKLEKWNSSKEGVRDYFFDFVPSMRFSESVEVVKNTSGGGLFAPGVIQYCYTYVNRYGQQSNIIWYSSLYYLSHDDRGASPEEKVNNSFTITIEDTDDNFDYIRLYSIQRTSLDNVPLVKHLTDMAIGKDAVLTYTDNGTQGSAMDPTELLYVGGREITALTMKDKDQTLFLGNITQPNTLVTGIQDYYDSLRKQGSGMGISFRNDREAKRITLDHTHSVYSHTNMLRESLRRISTFKGGETYRLGFQLQKRTGEWSDPIFLRDMTNTKYPSTNAYSDTVNLVSAEATIGLSAISSYLEENSGKGLDYSVYKRIRPVIVYPSIGERSVLCQGVLNPTVFNVLDRIDSTPFAQASWYFRPYMISEEVQQESVDITGSVTVTTSSYSSDLPIEGVYGQDFPTQRVYVLIADITSSSTLMEILARGSLKIRQERTVTFGTSSSRTYVTYLYHDFGAIRLSDTRYAFFSDVSWEKENTINDSNATITLSYADGVSVVYRGTDTAKLYTGIGKTKNNLYYYTRPDSSSPSTYVFLFHDSTTQYTIDFNDTGVTPDYQASNTNTTGSGLRFAHYTSLYSDEEANAGGTGDTDKVRMVEIQGSIGTSQSPVYGNSTARIAGARRRGSGKTGIDVDVLSNTQFYIDQSIVTLNSPDIEFDTEVQTYGMDGLKLRVIGAIPVTGCVSSHVITTSGNMLESLHNDTDAPDVLRYGSGENSQGITHENIDLFAGRRLVADYLWNDSYIVKDASAEDKVKTKATFYNFPVYPWHRTGSLNNDTRAKDTASSWLETKKESTLLYSINTEYFTEHSLPAVPFEEISTQIALTENNYVTNMRLPRQKVTSSEINYYPNIDKVLYNKDGYDIITKEEMEADSSTSTASERLAERTGGRVNTGTSETQEKVSNPVSMKYLSTSHAVIALNAASSTSESSEIPILPYGRWGSTDIGRYVGPTDNSGLYEAYWGDTKMRFSQSSVNLGNLFRRSGSSIAHNFLWLGELYKEVTNPFGGTSREAVRANTWQVAGEAVAIQDGTDPTIQWTDGDTYYQRYDCLKTYAFTKEDTNQLVEILSFMCETRVNIDGRYDRNRGQIDNCDMRPEIFGVLNPVYSQKDNFFTSRQSGIDDVEELTYPNHLTYTQAKTSGADVDEWTHVTLASTLELDGDKGRLNSLRRFNDQLIAFQDTGISQILYNENVQISSTQGVPIEIANSGKVSGKRYLSDTIGCSNKWAMAESPSGIYFMDGNDKGIYQFSGQLSNITLQGGMNTWAKASIPSTGIRWTPEEFRNFTAYYDRLNQDVLFTDKDRSLAFSERVGAFTSFYDYGATPYLCNLDDTGIWVRADGGLYRHNAGEYCDFFGVNKPYSMTLIGNPEPQADKIFTNLEFRASVDGDGSDMGDYFSPVLPFDTLETWDEYQHGIGYLRNRRGREAMLHHTEDNMASLHRKFRMWRCDIPRDNAPLQGDRELGVYRFKKHPLDRMRNPWIYLRLRKEAAGSGSHLRRTEVHDILMTYFS